MNVYIDKKMVKKLKSVARDMFWPFLTLVVCILIFRFLIMSIIVPSSSMEPKIKTGSFCLVNRLSYISQEPDRGDIVVFDHTESGKKLIKRIVGLPGEKITIKPDGVYINDQLLREEYLKETAIYTPAVFTVPDDSYFVLGDNRNGSLDARYWENPYINKNSIEGELMWNVHLSFLDN